MAGMDNPWYFVLGFAAQLLFSSRVIIQWLMSEKAKKVVSPAIYWQLSLLAAILLSVYGWLRGDFAIIIGQLLAYYIYIWNLHIKGNWEKIHIVLRYIILSIPIIALVYVASDVSSSFDRLFASEDIPLALLLFGSAGQLIFTLRFIYQWQYSYVRHESILPVGFWILSIIGASTIVVYGIFRHDPVLIAGHGIGMIIYIRTLWIAKKQRLEY